MTNIRKSFGWVKLQRSILYAKVWQRPNAFRVYAWCLLKMNFKTGYINWKTSKGTTTVTVNPYQFATGRQSGSDETGLHPSAWYRELRFLQQTGLITLKSNNQYTLVTVCKWPTSEGQKIPYEQRMNSGRTADDHNLRKIDNDKNDYSGDELKKYIRQKCKN